MLECSMYAPHAYDADGEHRSSLTVVKVRGVRCGVHCELCCHIYRRTIPEAQAVAPHAIKNSIRCQGSKRARANDENFRQAIEISTSEQRKFQSSERLARQRNKIYLHVCSAGQGKSRSGWFGMLARGGCMHACMRDTSLIRPRAEVFSSKATTLNVFIGLCEN